MRAGSSQSRVGQLTSQQSGHTAALPFFQSQSEASDLLRCQPALSTLLNKRNLLSLPDTQFNCTQKNTSAMGLADLFSDVISSFGFTEAQAEAPPAEETTAAGTEEQEDSKPAEEASEETAEDAAEQPEEEAEAEGEGEGEEAGGEEEEEEEKEEEEPEDIKPKLEEGEFDLNRIYIYIYISHQLGEMENVSACAARFNCKIFERFR